MAKTTDIWIAMDAPAMNFTQFSIRNTHAAHPRGPLTILKQSKNVLVSKLRVLSEFPAVPTRKTFSTDPQCSIVRDKQSSDRAWWEMLIRWRLPRDGSYSVEANQSKLRPQPKVTVRRLRD